MEKARKKEVTVEPIFWHYQTTTAGLNPVKLRVTAQRQTKNYPIQIEGRKVFLSEKDWEKIQAASDRELGKQLKKIKAEINIFKVNAINAVRKVTQADKPFSFAQFENHFFSKETSTGFMGEFEGYLNRILSENRVGTYRTYKNAYDAFKAFLRDREISAYDLTVDVLKAFERYLKTERKAGPTTVGMYARTLRIIYNLCADKDPNLKPYYPFGNNQRGKFKISDTRKGGKKGDALTADQIKVLIRAAPEVGSQEWEAKHYWLFSFYCQGMNFRDIAHLKFGNIQGNVIRYTRQKTKLTEDNEVIEVPIMPPIQEIFESLGKEKQGKASYIFRIIPDGEEDHLRIEGIVLQKIKMTNKWLKRLCQKVGIPVVTTYWARHTYASLLKHSGVPVEMIRELLGHSDLRTTEHYLKRFELKQKADVNKNLQALVNS